MITLHALPGSSVVYIAAWHIVEIVPLGEGCSIETVNGTSLHVTEDAVRVAGAISIVMRELHTHR